MIKSQTKLLTLTIMLLLAVILIVSFGCGGDSSGVIPQGDVSQTEQTENLITKDVEGIIYNISNSSKASEEEEDTFTVLPIPMEGEEGFLAQVNEYIAENPSSKASDAEMQELLTAFNEEAENYRPLPNWNSAAGLYGSYSDSEASTGISVGADGSFNASVLADADKDTVSLDVIVPDGEVFEVETISSDLLNSSETSEINLKGCPAKIITKPNRVVIFKVFSKPSANLYEAGLEFNLADSEVGVVCGPVFLRCFGARKTNVAYGLLYVNKSVSTPFDTAIEVSTAGGQSLSIPVQVVKNTAQVTGTVYSSSPIVKGWVKSIGPKSYCKIGADGTYTLPKTYMGTGRKFVAQWWSQEGNRKIKHREVKFVDIMGDCVVDFGVVVEPTPVSRNPMSPMYDFAMSKVIRQFNEWEVGLGTEIAISKTVNWINSNRSSSLNVPVEIEKAFVDEYNPESMWVFFVDGHCVCFEGGYGEEVIGNEELPSSVSIYNNMQYSEILSNAITVGGYKILILNSWLYEMERDAFYDDPESYLNDPETYVSNFYNSIVEGAITDELEGYTDINNNPVYNIQKVITGGFFENTPNFEHVETLEEIPKPLIVTTKTTGYISGYFHVNQLTLSEEEKRILLSAIPVLENLRGVVFESEEEFTKKLQEAKIPQEYIDDFILPYVGSTPGSDTTNASFIRHTFIKPGHEKNAVTIEDYLHLDEYDIIYFSGHGTGDAIRNSIMATFVYQNDKSTRDWIATNQEFIPGLHNDGLYFIGYRDIEVKGVPTGYADKVVHLTDNFFRQQTYKDSIVYIGSCSSWSLQDEFIDRGAKAFIGNNNSVEMTWERETSYKFFDYIIHGIDDNSPPMSLTEAYDTLLEEGLYTSPVFFGTKEITPRNNDIYFPVPVDIIVHKK